MKIEIETDCSYKATVIIDGRELEFSAKPVSFGTQWSFKGLKKGEGENTIGGMIATKLMDVLPDILQAWIPEFDNPKTGEAWGLWEKLDDETADQIYEKLS